MSNPREEAIEAMARAEFAYGGTYKRWGSVDVEVRGSYLHLASVALDALLALPDLEGLLADSGRAEQVKGWRTYKDMPHEEESECDEIGPYCDRLFRFLPPVSPDPEGAQ